MAIVDYSFPNETYLWLAAATAILLSFKMHTSESVITMVPILFLILISDFNLWFHYLIIIYFIIYATILCYTRPIFRT